MRKTLLFLALTLISLGAIAQTKWKIDPYHSSLNFEISHSGISIVNGKFLEYSGDLTTDGEALNGATFDFTVKTNSVDTDIANRDNHLRSADFFEVDTYPNMTFKSTKILATGKPNHYLLYGELTIKNVTKEVIFDTNYGGIDKRDEVEKRGMTAQKALTRRQYKT